MITNDLQLIEEPKKILSMNPKKFILWLFMASIIMLFAAMTSAYIVRQSEGNWLDFELPGLFWITTIIILLSSLTMHWGYISAKRDNLETTKTAMIITTLLGILFLVGQYLGWGALVDQDVYFIGNPSGSFLYVLTGLHGAHIIAGILFLLIILRATFKYEVHSKNMNLMEMGVTFWHFLGGLWLYLFMFLLLNR